MIRVYLTLGAVALLVFLAWRIDANAYDRGYAAHKAEATEAQRVADALRETRVITADTTQREVRQAAQAVAQETQTETAQAVERVRYVTRTVEIPVDCPVGVPDGVRDELAAAVERARAAAR